ADDTVEQRRLAGAGRADHGHQRAGLHVAVQMMHRRMAVVAERHIVEGKRCAHVQLAIAQMTAPHSATISAATAASRSSADSRRIEGDTVACGWAWPGWW